MRIQADPPVHLTYCLNIHPSETWEESLAAIREKTLAVKRLVAPDEPFGLGLRLSHDAAQTLSRRDTLDEFRRFLRENDLYVFTINGFPYGSFHGSRVKHEVYRPDWRSIERRDYTNVLADILAELLPEGVSGSISTVPLSYREWIKTPNDVERMVRELCACAGHFAELRNRTGADVVLALEPEPDCFLENTRETVAFFSGPLVEIGTDVLTRQQGISSEEAAQIIRRHLGVCVDVCHLAVEFEDPERSLKHLQNAGVRVAKVQLSSALRASPSEEALRRLREFCDDVYLHQVKVRTADGRVLSYRDLPDALKSRTGESTPDEEWRIHFHVPLYLAEYGELKSTASLYTPELAHTLLSGVTPHLEIETYTFDVLPDALRETDVTNSIAREFEWALRYMAV